MAELCWRGVSARVIKLPSALQLAAVGGGHLGLALMLRADDSLSDEVLWTEPLTVTLPAGQLLGIERSRDARAVFRPEAASPSEAHRANGARSLPHREVWQLVESRAAERGLRSRQLPFDDVEPSSKQACAHLRQIGSAQSPRVTGNDGRPCSTSGASSSAALLSSDCDSQFTSALRVRTSIAPSGVGWSGMVGSVALVAAE